MIQSSLQRIRETEAAAFQQLEKARLEAVELRRSFESQAKSLADRLQKETDMILQQQWEALEKEVAEESAPLAAEGRHQVQQLLLLSSGRINASVEWVIRKVVN